MSGTWEWIVLHWKVLFSGIGTLLVSLIIGWLLSKRRRETADVQPGHSIQNSTNVVTGSVGENSYVNQSYSNDKKNKPR